MPLYSYNIKNTAKMSLIQGHIPSRDEGLRDPRAF